MRDQKNSVKKTIMSKRAEYGLTRDVPCSEQENKTYSEMLKNGETLPEGVFPYSYTDGTKSDSAFYVLGVSRRMPRSRNSSNIRNWSF